MHRYIERNILDDVRQNIEIFFRCYPCNDCSNICAAFGTAVLIPTAFFLQLTALLVDKWATCSCVYDFGCIYSWTEESKSFCALEITCVVILGLIWIFEFVVWFRTWGRSITIEYCAVCHLCIISMLSLIPGILSICCCLFTMQFVSDHKNQHFAYQFSFYVFMVTGCLMLAISIVSICGYICVRWFRLRLRPSYDTQISSDDTYRETASLLNE